MVVPRITPLEELDSNHLGGILKALGNPVRIELLKALRSPKTVSEVRLQPRRKDQGLSPERFMSRVTVREHLQQLLEIGVVKHRQATRDGQTVDLYEVNNRQLFALTEELRQLVFIRPVQQPDDETQVAERDRPGPLPEGPHLRLVSGPAKGLVFPLDSSRAEWRIGRSRGIEVSLDYDPYLSTENSVLRQTADAFVVEDRGSSRNGTWLNWRRLPSGDSAALEHGDVIGAGRSLLLFRRG